MILEEIMHFFLLSGTNQPPQKKGRLANDFSVEKNTKNPLDPLCLGEAPRRESIVLHDF